MTKLTLSVALLVLAILMFVAPSMAGQATGQSLADIAPQISALGA